MNPILEIFMFTGIYLFIIGAHELGHWLFIYFYTKKSPKIKLKKGIIINLQPVRKLTITEYKNVLFGGILLGALALSFFAVTNIVTNLGFVLLTLLYGFGCFNDVKNLFQNVA